MASGYPVMLPMLKNIIMKNNNTYIGSKGRGGWVLCKFTKSLLLTGIARAVGVD